MEYLNAIENGALSVLTDLRLLIWTKSPSSNNSRFFATVKDAWAYCEENKKVCDVYSSLGLRHKDLPRIARNTQRDLRGGELDVHALLGLAMEFDIEMEGRAKSNLFVDHIEIDAFIGTLPMAPTMLVFSGGGVHAYWLFKEAWELNGDDERKQAKSTSLGWHQYVCGRSSRKIDSTYSLDRVYRVAGTVNHKYEHGVDVSILDVCSERRYDPADFAEWKADVSQLAGSSIRVEPRSQLSEKVKNLILLAPEFAEVWHHTAKRHHGKSQSEFDLSIANLLKDAGLSAREVADAIAYNREISGATAKPPGYYARTLEKAGIASVADPGSNGTEPAVEETQSEEGGGESDAETERESYFQAISRAVGVQVSGITYINREEGPTSYTFNVHLFSGARIRINGIAQLRSLQSWKNYRLMEPADQIQIPREIGKMAWEELIGRILSFANNTTVDEDTDEFKMLLSVHHFLLSVRWPKLDGKTRLEAETFASTGNPFMLGGIIYLGAEVFKRWYAMNNAKLDDALFSRALLGAGFERRRMFAQRRWWFVSYKKFLIKIGVEHGKEGTSQEGKGAEGHGDPSAVVIAGGSTGDQPAHRHLDPEDPDGAGDGVLFDDDQPN